MQIKYLGPGDSVNVAPYGAHANGETKQYPDDFAENLLATSKAQRFEAVDGTDEPARDTGVVVVGAIHESPLPESPLPEIPEQEPAPAAPKPRKRKKGRT